jgi:hypothetical protein
MSLDDVARFISQVGFPVAVAIVLLWHVMVIERRELAVLERIENTMFGVAALMERTARIVDRLHGGINAKHLE